MGIRERQGNRHSVQAEQQDPGEDLEVGDDKQGHGEEGVPAGGPHRHTLVHASGRPHQRPLAHLSEALPNSPSSLIISKLIKLGTDGRYVHTNTNISIP